MKKDIKCNCGLGNKIYCKKCSKVRMVICLKNGQEHLKLKRPDGSEYNPVWYSFLKYNRYDAYRVCEKMEANFKKHAGMDGVANVLLFYINGNRSHAIKRVDL